MAVIGMSTEQSCGVRDHAGLLATALAQEGIDCTMHWLDRSTLDLGPSRSEISSWARALAPALRRERPDGVLLHYSVFSHSQRGVPIFVPSMLRAARAPRAPMISFLHEFSFRQRGRSGPQGAVWALSQRAALLAVMRASAGAVVTVEDRVGWLRSRRWLPARPVAMTPVFSTLPPPEDVARSGEGSRLGLFGYTYPSPAIELVLDALARVRDGGTPATLTLLGAPGESSALGATWRAAAEQRGVGDALRFSGTVAAQQLSNMLSESDLLVFADRPGPTSRKTTLAGALASGTAVVATDGPSTWRAPGDAGALALVPAEARDLAAEIERLLGDADARGALGARGREFADSSMGAAASAKVIARMLDDALAARPAHARAEDAPAPDAAVAAVAVDHSRRASR